ncbi:MAG: AAA family ATPase [Actinobacteria bacterium]|nr:AAA family ATPase [Actinomycetota bacterium]
MARVVAVIGDPSVPGAVIEGPPGVGKTVLLQVACDEAADRGAAVLVGAATELRSRLPFAPLAEALGLKPDADDPGRAEVGALLNGTTSEQLDPGQLRWRVIEGILDDLERRTLRVPVVLALEDLHWSDADTLVALERLADAAGQLDLTMFVTARPQPRPSGLGATREALRDAGCAEVTLGELGPEEVEALAEQHLGRAVDDDMRRWLSAAGGNPLIVTELLTAGVDATADNRLAAAVTRRLAGLPDGCVRVLETAAVLGERFRLADLATVRAMSVAQTTEVLRPALDTGLVRDDRGDLLFRHALVRDHLYGRLGSAAQGALHREVAVALRDAGARPDAIGDHLARSAMDPTGALELLEVADAVADHAPAAAADWARTAREHLTDGDPAIVRARLTEARASALGLQYDRALEVVRPLLHAPIHATARADVAMVLTMVNLMRGREDDDVIDLLVASLDDTDAADQARTVAALALVQVGRVDEAVEVVGPFRADTCDDPTARCVALAVAAIEHLSAGRVQDGTETAAAGLELIRAAGLLSTWAGLEAMQLFIFTRQPGDDLSTAVLQQALVDAERAGFGPAALLAQAHFAEALAWRGDWSAADAHATTVLRADTVLHASTLLTAWFTLLFMAGRRGDLATFRRALAAEDAPSAGAGFYRRGLGMLEAWVLEINGEPDAGWRLAEQTRAHFETVDKPVIHIHGVPYLDLAVRLGHDDRARSYLAVLEEVAAHLGHPAFDCVVATGRALIDRDPDAARQALELTATVPVFPTTVEAYTFAGIALGENGHRDEAVEALTQAREIAVEVDATSDIARLDAALRDLGVMAFRPRQPRETVGWEALTEAEQRIVPLVAEGLIYREIGERLFISRRTVETHVARIFRKVGVRSRRDLTRAYLNHSP